MKKTVISHLQLSDHISTNHLLSGKSSEKHQICRLLDDPKTVFVSMVGEVTCTDDNMEQKKKF